MILGVRCQFKPEPGGTGGTSSGAVLPVGFIRVRLANAILAVSKPEFSRKFTSAG